MNDPYMHPIWTRPGIPHHRLATLGRRQAQLLILLLQHPTATNRELAQMLDRAPKTVEVNLSRVHRKLGFPPGVTRQRLASSGLTVADVVRSYRLPRRAWGRDAYSIIMAL